MFKITCHVLKGSKYAVIIGRDFFDENILGFDWVNKILKFKRSLTLMTKEIRPISIQFPELRQRRIQVIPQASEGILAGNGVLESWRSSNSKFTNFSGATDRTTIRWNCDSSVDLSNEGMPFSLAG